MNITPGYDFGATEIPTRARLRLMVDNMTITGIDIAQIHANLIGVKYGQTNTEMPGPGWMRSDLIGKLWVYDGQGEIAVWRANWGGYETRRYRKGLYTNTFIEDPTIVDRHRGYLRVFPDGDSNESNTYISAFVGSAAVGSSVKFLDSAYSGYLGRVLMRGATVGVGDNVGGVYTPGYVAIYQAVNVSKYLNQAFPAVNVTYGCRNRGMSVGWSRLLFMYWTFGGHLAVE